MSKKLNISKITDKEVIQGGPDAGCLYDCVHYIGNQAGGVGCQIQYDSMLMPLW